jgi:hypothetical protein
MKQIKTVNLSKELVFLIRGAVQEHGWNGANILCEWDDNSIGYGGTLVYNKLIKQLNGSYRIIRANNGSKCSIDDFCTKFIGKTLNQVERNKIKSVGQAMMGGSVSTHNHSYNEEVGFATPDGKYIVSIWDYQHFNNTPVSELTQAQFEKDGGISGIEVTLYEVTRDEFCERHGLGKSYTGWYNISNTFKNLRFKISPKDIVSFSRERYQYKDAKITYHFEDGDIVDIQTKTKYYFPSADGNNVQHYTDMTEVKDKDGDNFHRVICDDEVFEFELYHYNTVRKSQTDKILTLLSTYSEANINPTHYKKLDFPTIDVVSPDGTFITHVELFPNQSQWPSQFNNGKWVMVLTSESDSPFARMKVMFKNNKFEREVRKTIKDLAELNNLLSETSNTVAKKQEDQEVINYINILKDDTNPSNPLTLQNTEKLFGGEVDITTIIPNNDSEYQHKLDITFGKEYLVEWQKDKMDDEHYTELITRITMKHGFKVIVWVHGGVNQNLVNKMTNHLSNGRINMVGIDKVIIIDKNDIYEPNGYKKAITVFQQ